jgi:lauroyl/myristoyl acyltransferase
LLAKKRRERIKTNILLIRPDLTNRQVSQYAWQIVKTIAHSWASMLGNEFLRREEIARTVEVQGAEPLLSCYGEGKEIIITGVHIGPVDQTFTGITFYGLPFYIPVEALKPKWLLDFMMRLRLQFGDIIFEKVERGETLHRAARYLSERRVVILVVDTTISDKTGVLCRIGEAQMRFPAGPVKLALEQDATIFPVFPFWGEDGKARLVVGPQFELIRTGDMAHDIETNTRRLIEIYEPHILEHLDSWLRLLWSKLEPVDPENKK